MNQGNRGRDIQGHSRWNPGVLIIGPLSNVVRDIFSIVQERLLHFKKTIKFASRQRWSILGSTDHKHHLRNVSPETKERKPKPIFKIPSIHDIDDIEDLDDDDEEEEEEEEGVHVPNVVLNPSMKKGTLPRGLANTGNLCFLNSTLQALASLPSFVSSLDKVCGVISPVLTSKSPISSTLSSVLQELNAAQDTHVDLSHIKSTRAPKAVDPSVLAELIRRHQHQDRTGSSILGNSAVVQEQQDAQELLQALVQALSDESSHWGGSRHALTLKDIIPSNGSSAFSGGPCGLLGGWYGTSIECSTCHHKRPISHMPFISMTLALSDFPACAVRVESCIQALTAVEWLRGVNCTQCTRIERMSELSDSISFLENSLELDSIKNNKEEVEEMTQDLHEQRNALDRLVSKQSTCLCGNPSCVNEADCLVTMVRRSVSKRLLISRLPSVLILHVNRQEFCPQSGLPRKTRKKVLFSMELDMSPFCAFGGQDWRAVGSDGNPSSCDLKSSKIMYDLCAVIEHHGGAIGGHYSTFRKVSSGPDLRDNDAHWVHASDVLVEETTPDKVLACEAYLLFYERREL